MRAVWIALLIALLPLRGWVGDAMALSMFEARGHGATAVVATADAVIAPHDQRPHEHHDHRDHGSPHAAPALADAPADNDHGPAGAQAHLLCEVCNGPVLSPPASAVAVTAIEHAPRVERQQRFASLAPRQPTKPPIA
ncbi:hypothetical protein [Hydrogenophaga sp. T2]|uniref:hypothetical protein n=1 Tax=Hydrogenophaga sp. T2 TaxID=3132823 RepID=UPI003CF99392